MTTHDDPATVMATYFESWRTKDFAALRSVLADDATFTGPMGQAGNGDECARGVEQLSQITTDVAVRKTFVDGADVLTWFDLHTTVAPPCPVANWSHVEDGKVTRIQVTFDPRSLL